MVCAAQAQGVFSFFNKPGQKGQQGARRTPQANSSHAKEEDTRGVNEDWGNQQVQWPSVTCASASAWCHLNYFLMQSSHAPCHAKLPVMETSIVK